VGESCIRCGRGALFQFAVRREKLPTGGAGNRFVVLQLNWIAQSQIAACATKEIIHHATHTSYLPRAISTTFGWQTQAYVSA
jgi:hypothetical protein